MAGEPAKLSLLFAVRPTALFEPYLFFQKAFSYSSQQLQIMFQFANNVCYGVIQNCNLDKVNFIIDWYFIEINSNNMLFGDNKVTTTEIPTYSIRINTSAFKYKQSFLKEKMQKEYLPQYWEKCRMDQKHINPSCEDRLSELTTGQIDRIIDMEKIRTLLNDKKLKAKDVYFEYDTTKPNTHPHIYQANFLAKINAIAIRRNIRHQKSQGFDQYFGDKNEGEYGEKQKKTTQVPYRYVKKYKQDSKLYKRSKNYRAEDDDEKSIESIKDQIDEFEKKIQNKKALISNPLKKARENEKSKHSLRWFNGMSNHYLYKNKQIKHINNTIERMANFDIESELKDYQFQSHKRSQSFTMAKAKTQTSSISHYQSNTQPFVKYRINRIQKISSIK